MARDGLARERGGVELGHALDDGAVDGNALARLDHNDGSHSDLVRVDLLELAVLTLDVCVVRGDIHHGGDGLATLADGVCLEQLAHLVEEHDRRALGHVWVSVGEEDHREGADRGDGHEERLVKGLAATDVAVGLPEDIVASDDEGHEI